MGDILGEKTFLGQKLFSHMVRVIRTI